MALPAGKRPGPKAPNEHAAFDQRVPAVPAAPAQPKPETPAKTGKNKNRLR